MIQVQGLAKQFGRQILFEGVHWHVRARRRYGLVGPNGAGKTTLLRILMGELHADAGAVVRGRHVRVGYLPQEVDSLGEGSVLEAVLQGVPGYYAAQEAVRSVHERMAHDADGGWSGSDEALTQLDRATTAYEMLGGDKLEVDARAALSGLGFDMPSLERPAAALSGGWRMRAALARLLVQRPEVLLLDEPTNHLDFESLAWFESFLEAYEGAVVAVSHDRYFLNRIPTHIVELTKKGIHEYPGGYEAFLDGKAARLDQQEAQKVRVDRQRAHLESFVERFRAKASKAKQAQSRMKMLARLESVELDSETGSICLRLPDPGRTGREVLSAVHVKKAWGAQPVYDDLNLTVWRGDKVALVGPNGAGKSTLLKLLAGVTDIQGGEVRYGAGVKVDYYAQHQLDILDATSTVYEEARRAAGDQTVSLVRKVLGTMQFSGQTVDKRVAVLSGGERARLALAKMVLRAPNVLLLDEPTNHLDLTSREVLEDALSAFPGTVVLVSHDRYFINAVATSVLEVTPGGQTTPYLGDYDAYLYRKGGGDPDVIERLLRGEAMPEREAGKPQAQLPVAQKTPPQKTQPQKTPPQKSAEKASEPAMHAPRPAPASVARDDEKARKRDEAEKRNDFNRRTKPLRERLAAAETAVTQGEARLAELANAQMDPALYEDGDRVRALLLEQAGLKQAVATAMGEWEDLSLRLEALADAAGE